MNFCSANYNYSAPNSKEQQLISYIFKKTNEIIGFLPFTAQELNTKEKIEVSKKLHGRHNNKFYYVLIKACQDTTLMNIDFFNDFESQKPDASDFDSKNKGTLSDEELFSDFDRNSNFSCSDHEQHEDADIICFSNNKKRRHNIEEQHDYSSIPGLVEKYALNYSLVDNVYAKRLLSRKDYTNLLKVIHTCQYLAYRCILKTFVLTQGDKFAKCLAVDIIQNVSLQSIADYFEVTKWHFHRVFKSFTNVTIKEYKNFCLRFCIKHYDELQSLISDSQVFYNDINISHQIKDLKYWSNLNDLSKIPGYENTQREDYVLPEMIVPGFFIENNIRNANETAATINKKRKLDRINSAVLGHEHEKTIKDADITSKKFNLFPADYANCNILSKPLRKKYYNCNLESITLDDLCFPQLLNKPDDQLQKNIQVKTEPTELYTNTEMLSLYSFINEANCYSKDNLSKSNHFENTDIEMYKGYKEANEDAAYQTPSYSNSTLLSHNDMDAQMDTDNYEDRSGSLNSLTTLRRNSNSFCSLKENKSAIPLARFPKYLNSPAKTYDNQENTKFAYILENYLSNYRYLDKYPEVNKNFPAGIQDHHNQSNESIIHDYGEFSNGCHFTSTVVPQAKMLLSFEKERNSAKNCATCSSPIEKQQLQPLQQQPQRREYQTQPVPWYLTPTVNDFKKDTPSVEQLKDMRSDTTNSYYNPQYH